MYRICICLISLVGFLSAHDWAYLYSDVFKLRYVLAAHMVSDCEELIEIGSYRTPISDFVTNKKRIVLIDPLSTEKCHGCVESYRQLFSDCSFAPLNSPYGIIMIGLCLEGMRECDWKNLFDLINNAQSVVIEFPEEWTPSIAQFDLILSNTNKKIVQRVLLDLSNNDFGDLSNSWVPRTRRLLFLLKTPS